MAGRYYGWLVILFSFVLHKKFVHCYLLPRHYQPSPWYLCNHNRQLAILVIYQFVMGIISGYRDSNVENASMAFMLSTRTCSV